MAHFAKLDNNNIVIAVLVGRDEDEHKELELSERTCDTYKRTSYNTYGGVHRLGGTAFRFNYAGIGYYFDEVKDGFIPPKCHDEAVVNDKCLWNCTNADHNDPLVK